MMSRDQSSQSPLPVTCCQQGGRTRIPLATAESCVAQVKVPPTATDNDQNDLGNLTLMAISQKTRYGEMTQTSVILGLGYHDLTVKGVFVIQKGLHVLKACWLICLLQNDLTAIRDREYQDFDVTKSMHELGPSDGDGKDVITRTTRCIKCLQSSWISACANIILPLSIQYFN